MRRLAFAVAVLLGVAAFAPAPLTRPRKDDGFEVSARTLRGLWRVEAFASTSATGNHAVRKWHIKYVRIERDRWTFMNSATSENVSYGLTIDGTRQPASLDFFDEPRDGSGRPCGVGIVSRRHDDVCVIYTFKGPEGRAESFERPPDHHWIVWLKRVR
jgi:hypothetical protein